jgi:hypothetical protein
MEVNKLEPLRPHNKRFNKVTQDKPTNKNNSELA